MSTPPTRHRGRPLTAETPLSLRERAFVNEYLTDFNPRRAAMAVGYKGSLAAISVRASKLLATPHIHAALTREVNLQTASFGSTPSTTLRETAWVAHADISRIFSEDGITIRKITDLPIEVRRCIASVKVVKRNLTAGDGKVDEVIEVKFWNKNQALELLAKCQGLIDGQAQEQPAEVSVFTLPPGTTGVSIH
jgi:hypothetical protein